MMNWQDLGAYRPRDGRPNALAVLAFFSDHEFMRVRLENIGYPHFTS